MLKLAFLIGGYCYTIFLLGILGFLYKETVILFALFYLIVGAYFLIKEKHKKISIKKIGNLSKLLFFLIFIQALVNLIGVLGPELSFDALWYHLTIPQIFLENHKIFHIPGAILYYSDMPKNIEMLYVFALSVGNEVTAKFTHFLLGIASIIVLYKLARRFLDERYSLLSVIVFYSSLVVGWQSITAYIDLGTTFFTIISIKEFLNWVEKRNNKHLLYLAILIGLSISTKITSVILIPIFALLVFVVGLKLKKDGKTIFIDVFKVISVSVLISLPWFIFSYLNTGNPFFPIFSKGFSFAYNISPINLLRQIIFPSDPINPIYAVIFPLFFILYKRFKQSAKFIFFFAILSFLCWIFLSPIGGSRLILPYLPVFSILVVYCIELLKNTRIKQYLVLLILIIAVSSISYRLFANAKYIPVIIGKETKEKFLTDNLNFSYGDFYDTDNFFVKNIKQNDKVITYGFHNLYYVDFPFIDSSFVQKGDKFNYIAVQSSVLPKRFSNFKEIHYNAKTNVRVYSDGGKTWVY